MQRLIIWTGALFIASMIQGVSAHSEHDKPRYVSQSGKDVGYCENALRPCKSIAYAVQHANKGDRVLVAGGQYQIKSTEELFYLKSEIVPILAGFNRFDHFQSQSPDINQTFLLGIPTEMAPSLREKGFKIIDDGKSQQSSEELSHKMAAFSALSESQSDVTCSGGAAGSFPCLNVDLVAHMPLSSFSSSPSAANDIWGHIDLNTGREYAILGLRNGAAIVDVSRPTVPVEVGTITGSSTTWRDIKVYQFFDDVSNRWKAYAYVTIDGASDGVTIIDLNNLPDSVSLLERNTSVGNAHNVYISNVDHSLNIKLENTEPQLQLIGSNQFSGSFHSYSLDDPTTISVVSNQSGFNGYTHDGASVTIDDSRKDSDCFNAGPNCTVFVDFNVNEMVLWDVTQPDDTQMLSQIGYSDVSASNQYIHSGWVTEDKRFVLLHDEFDEFRGGLNSTVRIFQIDDLRNPVQVGQWTGPTRAIDHNGFVRGNRYYMSNYERGLTVLDITDPANPFQRGYFDTFPSSDSSSFNGAWGVYPYLPSGLILVSDINSGLYILRDNTQANPQGVISFDSDEQSVDGGSELTVSVSRTDAANSATSATVHFEVLSGSAIGGSDFTATNSTLSWSGSETGSKTFSITIADDPSGNEIDETFYIRLYDPTSGASLTEPAYQTVTINGAPNAGVVEFMTNELTTPENAGSITLEVNRVGGSSGAASVDYQLVAGTASAGADYETTTGTLNWDDGELSTKSFTVNIIDDSDLESDETFSVQLSSASGATLGGQTEFAITISDNESNSAPSVALAEDFQVNTGQSVTLTSTVSDPEDDPLIYLWQQTAGTSVTISNADQSQASFVAPSTAEALTFSLTVTDDKGAESSDEVQVSVIAPVVIDPEPEPEPRSNSGSGSMGAMLLMLAVLARRRRSLR